MRPWLLLPLCLAGCPPKTSEFTFPDDYAASFCSRADTCLWPDLPQDYEDCEVLVADYVDGIGRRCAGFSLKAARTCLRELRTLTCDEGLLYVDLVGLPGTCSSTYIECR